MELSSIRNIMLPVMSRNENTMKRKIAATCCMSVVQVNFNLISPRELQKSPLFYGTKVLSSFLVTGL